MPTYDNAYIQPRLHTTTPKYNHSYRLTRQQTTTPTCDHAYRRPRLQTTTPTYHHTYIRPRPQMSRHSDEQATTHHDDLLRGQVGDDDGLAEVHADAVVVLLVDLDVSHRPHVTWPRDIIVQLVSQQQSSPPSSAPSPNLRKPTRKPGSVLCKTRQHWSELAHFYVLNS